MYQRYEELISQKKITTYRLCKETGIPASTFSDWKKGKSTPKIDKMIKIADYLGVNVEYLLGTSIYKNEHDKNLASLASGLSRLRKDKTQGETDNEQLETPQDIYIVPVEFIDPEEARKYIGMHAIFGSEGFRLDRMNDEEVIRFANELLRQMELISYKYKK